MVYIPDTCKMTRIWIPCALLDPVCGFLSSGCFLLTMKTPRILRDIKNTIYCRWPGTALCLHRISTGQCAVVLPFNVHLVLLPPRTAKY